MTIRIEVYSPSLTTGPYVVYETGEQGRLFEGVAPIPRNVDVYAGRDVLASAGTWTTSLHDPDGLFAVDGVFGMDWRQVTIVALVDNVPVFVGRADQIRSAKGSAGLRTQVRWRDLVDDFLAQTIDGVDPEGSDGNLFVVRTNLRDVLDEFGIELLAAHEDIDLWYPEQTTTLRQWLWPVVAALGYSLDWTATIAANVLTAKIQAVDQRSFGNQGGAGLPVFIDTHLVGDSPALDHGREQIVNSWTGRRRIWDPVELKFDTEAVNAFGSLSFASPARASRQEHGTRNARINLSQIDAPVGRIRGIVDTLINRRLWPHSRAVISLDGPDAAALRIGDGLLTAFNFKTNVGRGMVGVWRVIGRTLDLERETTQLRIERRDARDPDYQFWHDNGAPQFYAET